MVIRADSIPGGSRQSDSTKANYCWVCAQSWALQQAVLGMALSPPMLSSVLALALTVMVAGTLSVLRSRRHGVRIQSWLLHPAEHLPSSALSFPASPPATGCYLFQPCTLPSGSPFLLWLLDPGAPAPLSAPVLRAAVSRTALFPSHSHAE